MAKLSKEELKKLEDDRMLGIGSGIRLKNSGLTCFNCIFVYSPDTNVAECSVYSLKPSNVLDGGECDKKKTHIELIEQK